MLQDEGLQSLKKLMLFLLGTLKISAAAAAGVGSGAGAGGGRAAWVTAPHRRVNGVPKTPTVHGTAPGLGTSSVR